FLGFELGADGGGGEHLWLPGSGSRHFDNPETFVKMNGREVFKFATRVMVTSAQAVLDECGRSVEEVDVYVPHQANVRIMDPAAMEVYRAGSEAAGIDLLKLCFDTPLAQMVETEVQQPALVATSLAINEAILSRGIKPDFVIGHSVGEFAALAAAKSLPVAEAVALVRERGLAMAA